MRFDAALVAAAGEALGTERGEGVGDAVQGGRVQRVPAEGEVGG